jgi:transcriptional regulator with XRE-family HTH domain
MDRTVNQRVRLLRKELKLTQTEFSSVISISAGQLACIETDKRVVNNRTIKLICDSFHVNGEWLRTGEGSIFSEENGSENEKLIALYNSIRPKYQSFILETMNFFLKVQDEELDLSN